MTESLFHVEAALSRLMNQRADLIEALPLAPTPEDQASIGRAIEALELQIQEHAKPAAMAKVDAFRAYYLFREMRRDACRKEKQRQAANEKAEDDVLDFLKRIGKSTLEEIGKDRIEGKLGVIRLQTNGGPEPPPLISQPEMVPDSMCIWRGSIADEQLKAMVKIMEQHPEWSAGATRGLLNRFERIPSPDIIRAELEKPCPTCKGIGIVDLERGEQADCPACNGSCLNAVPGCSLQVRGRHLRVA